MGWDSGVRTSGKRPGVAEAAGVAARLENHGFETVFPTTATLETLRGFVCLFVCLKSNTCVLPTKSEPLRDRTQALALSERAPLVFQSMARVNLTISSPEQQRTQTLV